MESLLAALQNSASADSDVPNQHSDPIELSNACRAFYQSRLESARALKEKWGPSAAATASAPGTEAASCAAATSRAPGDAAGEVTCGDRNENCRKKSSIDVAMETLRQEMTSLMEQDLSLMRQLLTLNEEIEELKWRRRYCWASRASSLMTSSGDVDLGSLASFTSSEASLAWGWRGESGDLLAKYPGVSSLSLQGDHNRLSVYDEEDPTGTFNSRRGAAARLSRLGSLRTLTTLAGGVQGHYHQQQHHHHQQQQQQQQYQHQQQQYQLQQQQRPQKRHSVSETTSTTVTSEDKAENSFAERESFDSGIHEGYVEPTPPAAGRAAAVNSSTEVTQL